MTKVFSYIRFSTKEQIKGNSLERQYDLAVKFCEKYDYTLNEEYQFFDSGVSAFKGSHVKNEGDLKRFLSICEEGVVKKEDILLVENLDRLSREDPFSAIHQLLTIVNFCTLVTLENGVSSPTFYRKGDEYQQMSTKLIMATMIATRAHEESKTKSDRLKSAWKNKRSKANQHILTKNCPFWLIPNENKTGFDLIQDSVDVVRMIFEMYSNGLGVRKICSYLNGNGYKSPKNRLWAQSTVKRILYKESVIGNFYPTILSEDGNTRITSDEAIKDYYPRIISDETFYKCQNNRAAKRITTSGGRKGDTFSNIFSKVAKCGYCHASMNYVNKGKTKKGGLFLVCSTKIKGGNCDSKKFIYHDSEVVILQSLPSILPKLLSDFNESENKNKINSDKMYSQKLQKEHLLKQLLDKFESSDNNLILEKMKSLEGEIKSIEKDIKSIEAATFPSKSKNSYSILLESLLKAKTESELFIARSKINQSVKSYFPDGLYFQNRNNYKIIISNTFALEYWKDKVGIITCAVYMDDSSKNYITENLVNNSKIAVHDDTSISVHCPDGEERIFKALIVGQIAENLRPFSSKLFLNNRYEEPQIKYSDRVLD